LQTWFSVQAKAPDSKIIEADIYESIGYFGVSAIDFIRGIKAQLPADEIILNINSPGGEVWDGLAIYNYLKGISAKVTVNIMGLAASAASFVAMAGDKVVMPGNSLLMIHNAWTYTGGNKEGLKQALEMLQKADNSIISIYAAKTGLDTAELATMMDAETWMSADEAFAKGFADEVTKEVKLAASFDLSAFSYQHTPDFLVKNAGVKPCKIVSDDLGEKPVTTVQNPTPALFASVEALAQAYPELYAQAVNKAREEGAKAEAKRIKGIEESTLKGYEGLANALKFDGKSTAETLAVAIVAKQKEAQAVAKAVLEAETPAPIAAAPTSLAEGSSPQAKWDTDAALRAEYGNNFELYNSYLEGSKAGAFKELKDKN
jgi:ATP-dependent Clp protease, protease subunit